MEEDLDALFWLEGYMAYLPNMALTQITESLNPLETEQD